MTKAVPESVQPSAATATTALAVAFSKVLDTPVHLPVSMIQPVEFAVALETKGNGKGIVSLRFEVCQL
jgi:hypothetical protein